MVFLSIMRLEIQNYYDIAWGIQRRNWIIDN